MNTRMDNKITLYYNNKPVNIPYEIVDFNQYNWVTWVKTGSKIIAIPLIFLKFLVNLNVSRTDPIIKIKHK